MPDKGIAGYTTSAITITRGGTYVGDGTNGYSGGTTYTFAVKERNLETIRSRQDTTVAGYGEGVGGPVAKKVTIKGFYRTANLPPAAIAKDEFILLQAQVNFTFTGVILVESYKEVGVIDGALNFEISGTSDGTFLET